MNETVTKEDWVKGCINPLLSFLAQVKSTDQSAEFATEKKTPKEWNQEYVEFCQRYF